MAQVAETRIDSGVTIPSIAEGKFLKRRPTPKRNFMSSYLKQLPLMPRRKQRDDPAYQKRWRH